MTVREFVDLVAKVRYKPGWKLETDVSKPWAGRDSVMLLLTARVEDAYRDYGHVGGPVSLRYLRHERRMVDEIEVQMRREISFLDVESMDAGKVVSFLRDFLRSAEEHESDEWFVVDGVRPYDPHRERPVTTATGRLR